MPVTVHQLQVQKPTCCQMHSTVSYMRVKARLTPGLTSTIQPLFHVALIVIQLELLSKLKCLQKASETLIAKLIGTATPSKNSSRCSFNARGITKGPPELTSSIQSQCVKEFLIRIRNEVFAMLTTRPKQGNSNFAKLRRLTTRTACCQCLLKTP